MNNENKTNINWYPGHMAKTKRQIKEDLKLIDLVVELLDARIPISSRNPDIEEITKGKKKIIVLNKSDLAEEKENLVFILWGSYAQKKGAFIDRNKHLVLTSAHPSPLSAYNGFFGNKHFSRTNDYLKTHGKTEIAW